MQFYANRTVGNLITNNAAKKQLKILLKKARKKVVFRLISDAIVNAVILRWGGS